jgi:hypothetical protein
VRAETELPSQCATTGRAVFGGRFGHVWGGGQAERVRVPFADHLCEKVDPALSDDDALFLGDVLQGPHAEDGHLQRAQLHRHADAAREARQAAAGTDRDAHHGPRRGAARLYAIFDKKEDRAIKVMLKP